MAQTKDYYSVLGVSGFGDAGRGQEAVPEARRQAPPGQKPERSEGRRALQGDLGGVSGPGRRREAQAVRQMRHWARSADSAAASDAAGRGSSPGQARRIRSAAARFGSRTSTTVGLGGIGDLFSSMFGGGARGARGRADPSAARTSSRSSNIPFRVAALGGKVPIELEVNEECPTCHGSGAAPGAKIQTCPECQGRGTISFGQGGFAVQRPCPMCLGKGTVPSERCPTCNGAGEVRTRKKVMITVAPGVDTGTKIRLKGQGGRGTRNAPPGDLLITFQVEAGSLLPARGARRRRARADQHRAGDARVEDQRQDARRKKGRDQDSRGNAGGKTIPCARSGHHEGRPHAAT